LRTGLLVPHLTDAKIGLPICCQRCCHTNKKAAPLKVRTDRRHSTREVRGSSIRPEFPRNVLQNYNQSPKPKSSWRWDATDRHRELRLCVFRQFDLNKSAVAFIPDIREGNHHKLYRWSRDRRLVLCALTTVRCRSNESRRQSLSSPVRSATIGFTNSPDLRTDRGRDGNQPAPAKQYPGARCQPDPGSRPRIAGICLRLVRPASP
jgi:hypothetical protein